MTRGQTNRSGAGGAECPGDLLLAGWSLKHRVQMFTNVFGRQIRLQRLGEDLRS